MSEAFVAVAATARSHRSQLVAFIFVQATQCRAKEVALVNRFAEGAAVDELFATVVQALEPSHSILVSHRLLLLLGPAQVAQPVGQRWGVAHYKRGDLFFVLSFEHETFVIVCWRLK